MFRRLSTAILVLVLLAILLPGCAPAAPLEIRIGLDVPMTGDHAYVGTQSDRAAKMWADEVNGAGGLELGGKKYSIKLVLEDNESKPESATAAATKLITQDRGAGHRRPAVQQARAVPTGEVANENETPMISPVVYQPQHHSKPAVGLPRTCFLDPFQGPVVANFRHRRSLELRPRRPCCTT